MNTDEIKDSMEELQYSLGKVDGIILRITQDKLMFEHLLRSQISLQDIAQHNHFTEKLLKMTDAFLRTVK